MPAEGTPADFRRLESLIDQVLDVPPEHRAGLIAEITGGDPEREAELARMIEQCERDLPLLDRPAAERFSALLVPAPAVFPAGLSDRYRVTREVGQGGMATVFLARDLRHDRDVAVKIMLPDLALLLGRERFLREIAIAARLRHPGIVPLFDSGEADGLLYYVMPYEAGHSLRERLARDGPLPLEETLLILRDVCDALSYAHQQGVVHRDIKPDNVLLAGRRAMVTDFGIARALQAAADVTGVGVVPGTPAYMAPERRSGETDPDLRGDVYAIGVMGYEMLAGTRPPGSDVAIGDSAARARLSAARPELPPAVTELIGRCLANDPAQRFGNATEVLAALEGLAPPLPGPSRLKRGLMVAAAVGLVVATLAFLWTRRPAPTAGGGPAPRLAVTVFQHGSDSELEPLAIGLTDQLIGALGDVPGLVVRSLQAVLPYRDSVTPTAVLGRRLDVAWLVGGRLYRVGERTVVSVQLTEATTGRLIARTEASAAPGQDVGLIEDIVTRVATMLRERMGDEVRVRDWRAGTRIDAAFAAVYRAHQERREADRLSALRDIPGALVRMRRADLTLDSAARADPRWAEPPFQRAVVALHTAAILYGSGTLSDSIPAVLAHGMAQARAALAIDPGSTRVKEGLGLLFYNAYTMQRRHDSAAARLAAAEQLLREVSEADTTLVDALTVLSSLHFSRGEYQQAYVTAERAYRADAFSRDPQEVLSRLFTFAFEAEEDAEARRWCAQYRARFADDWLSGYCRLTLIVWSPDLPESADSAIRIAREASAAAPSVIRSAVTAQLQTLAAGALASAGDPARARQMLAAVAAASAADPTVRREPFASELLEIEAGVRLRLGELEAAGRLVGELLRRHPERAARLSVSRRFRGMSIDIPPTALRP